MDSPEKPNDVMVSNGSQNTSYTIVWRTGHTCGWFRREKSHS
jgi:hypothetical protein